MDALDLIRAAYDYNDWANRQVIAAVEAVGPAQFRASYGASSFDSLGNTLAHLLVAEMLWLHRWQHGPARMAQPFDEQRIDLAELRAAWRRHQSQLGSFLMALTTRDLAAEVHYQSSAGVQYAQPLWRIILHPVNHGTHHRSEVADMLSRSGARAPWLEMIQFERLSEAERSTPAM
ncbi:MAG: DinB family protein [Chloroflexi bacterium]|nr:DinB family protein [Chloroflexota bacterium]